MSMEANQLKTEKTDTLLTVSEAARLANCTENRIRYQLQQGNIKTLRNAAGKIRVSRNEVITTLLTFK